MTSTDKTCGIFLHVPWHRVAFLHHGEHARSPKDQAVCIHGVIVEVLRDGDYYDGLTDVEEILAAASIVGVDLLSDWKPDAAMLRLFPEKALVKFVDLCGVAAHETDPEILAENRPAGTMPTAFPESMRSKKAT